MLLPELVSETLKTKDHDPKLHAAIKGRVEEFAESLDMTKLRSAKTFVRIGVEGLKKPEERRFERPDLGDHNGYAYEYTKRIATAKGKPEMTIYHSFADSGACE